MNILPSPQKQTKTQQKTNSNELAQWDYYETVGDTFPPPPHTHKNMFAEPAKEMHYKSSLDLPDQEAWHKAQRKLLEPFFTLPFQPKCTSHEYKLSRDQSGWIYFAQSKSAVFTAQIKAGGSLDSTNQKERRSCWNSLPARAPDGALRGRLWDASVASRVHCWRRSVNASVRADSRNLGW